MRAILLAVAAAVWWSGPAAAQTYQLEWWYAGTPVAAGTTVGVPASATATFELYIREFGGTTLQTKKLSAFGVRGTYGTPGVLSVASAAPPDLAPDPGFELPSSQQATAGYFQFAGTTFTDKSSDATGRIRLGSVRFQTAASGITTLTAADIPDNPGPPAQPADNWFFGGPMFEQFDPQVQAYQIFVAPVPEPAVVGLLAAAGLLAARRRLGNC